MPGVPDYENRSEEEVAEASQAGSQAGLFNELIAQLVQVHQQALSDQAALREEVLRLFKTQVTVVRNQKKVLRYLRAQ